MIMRDLQGFQAFSANLKVQGTFSTGVASRAIMLENTYTPTHSRTLLTESRDPASRVGH